LGCLAGASYTAPVPRFFVTAEQVGGGRGAIVGTDAAHLARALRVRPGELVRVVDDAGVEHGLRVDAVSRERVEGAVEWSRPVTGEPPLRVHVLQALPQGGIDAAVDTLTAVGVASIRPFFAERGVARPDARRAGARRERWRTIAREAAQQALRGSVPEVHEPATLPVALDALPSGCLLLVAHVGAEQHIAALDLGAAADVAVVIGPEGGLSPREADALEARAARAVHLGPRVLRSRLAGTIAVALLIGNAERADVSPAARP
jgi:16S rRNA (uracil1498-N3)-methyltransferase